MRMSVIKTSIYYVMIKNYVDNWVGFLSLTLVQEKTCPGGQEDLQLALSLVSVVLAVLV